MTSQALSTPQTARHRRRRREFSLTFEGPVVRTIQILLAVFYTLPIVWIILTSLKRSEDVGIPAKLFWFTPTLQAYTSNLTHGLLQAGSQSFLIALGSTVVVIVFALPAAYGLARAPGHIIMIGLGVLVVLQMLPQSATVLPLFQVLAQVGLLDHTLGVVLANGGMLTPWAILILRPFFRAVPKALEESAAIDGAGSLRTFFSIILPIARNGAATTATLVFMISWGEFLYSINFFLDPQKYPLSALLARQITIYNANWPGLMSLSVLTAVPILILFIFTYRLLKEGLTLGAVK